MQAQLSEERMQQLRERSRIGREQEDAARPQVIAEHKAMLLEWQKVVASHCKGIDSYLAIHGPMSRAEVIDLALSKLLADD